MDSLDDSVLIVPVVDDDGVGVGDRHARFIVNCVKHEALNLVAMSAIFVCTTQTYADTSTATHVDIPEHSSKQSDSDVYGYNFPFNDATSSCLVHSSHAAKHSQIIKQSNKWDIVVA